MSYEFEIYQHNDNEPTYIVNDSPDLTPDFIDFLEEIGIDITKCIYKVNKLYSHTLKLSLTNTN